MLAKEIIRGQHQEYSQGWYLQVRQACRLCRTRWPCDVIQLLDALETAERSLRDLAQKADALLTEIPGCRCHEDYRRIGKDDPGCPYHEIGAEVIEDLRDALGRMGRDGDGTASGKAAGDRLLGGTGVGASQHGGRPTVPRQEPGGRALAVGGDARAVGRAAGRAAAAEGQAEEARDRFAGAGKGIE